MWFRIWTLLCAVVLLAAPANAAFPEVDPQHEHTCDELVTQTTITLPAPTPARVSTVRADRPPPPSPALSQIFRPPRPSFD